MNANNLNRLNEIISEIKNQYPFYEYTNALKDKSKKYNLGENTYAIVVSGILKADLKAFLAFLDNKIILPIVERDEELPLIIPLTECTTIDQWKETDLTNFIYYNNLPSSKQFKGIEESFANLEYYQIVKIADGSMLFQKSINAENDCTFENDKNPPYSLAA